MTIIIALLFLRSYSFSPSGNYRMPPSMDYNSVLEHIRALPMIAKPEVFGLHENADITKDNKEANAVSYCYSLFILSIEYFLYL